MKRTRLLFLVGLLLAACTTQNPSSAPTDEVMLRDGYFPKVLVTVEISATPNPDQIAAAATPTPNIQATIDELAPTATPSPTPTTYVGVFLGEPTSVGPEGEFIIPPTLVPLVGQPADGSGINAQGNVPQITILSTTAGCTIPPAAAFATAYTSNPNLQAFGCPLDTGGEISLVTQRFERGRMFWRDTRQMIVLGDSGTFWRITDNWQEGMPADDPSLIPPSGMSQPVRGFGLAWRENEAFRTTLGWAVGPEFPITGYWQEFQGGTLLLGDGNQIYAIPAGGTGQYFRG